MNSLINSEVNNNMFNDLLSFAKEILSKANQIKEGLQESQAIVFTTAKSYTYVSVGDTPQEICSQLISDNDTRILKLLTMWKNGQVDLPSLAFRKAILEMNIENKDTNILLQGKEGLIVKKLFETTE